jgi:chemotaxis family two-component system sensor kinase Cph1
VLQNLVDNAAKYMGGQTSPTIEIGSREDGQQTVYFVRDNGMGIDPQYKEKVFGLFDQLDQKAEGTGVGLALAKRIVEFHGGKIWVESPGPGEGSTFCFTIASETDE